MGINVQGLGTYGMRIPHAGLQLATLSLSTNDAQPLLLPVKDVASFMNKDHHWNCPQVYNAYYTTTCYTVQFCRRATHVVIYSEGHNTVHQRNEFWEAIKVRFSVRGASITGP